MRLGDPRFGCCCGLLHVSRGAVLISGGQAAGLVAAAAASASVGLPGPPAIRPPAQTCHPVQSRRLMVLAEGLWWGLVALAFWALLGAVGALGALVPRLAAAALLLPSLSFQLAVLGLCLFGGASVISLFQSV